MESLVPRTGAPFENHAFPYFRLVSADLETFTMKGIESRFSSVASS